MLSFKHINWNKLKIHLFLMETNHGTGGVSGQGKTIKLESHFIKHKRLSNAITTTCEREREREIISYMKMKALLYMKSYEGSVVLGTNPLI